MAKVYKHINKPMSSIEVINVDTQTLINRKSCKNALSSMGKAAVASGMAQSKKMTAPQKKIFAALEGQRMKLRNEYYRVCVQKKKPGRKVTRVF